uniref:Uncharacterized protein n=1 Tax=Arundo donax TaxID=35708 RepID=A0A0A9A6M2_ARUDO
MSSSAYSPDLRNRPIWHYHFYRRSRKTSPKKSVRVDSERFTRVCSKTGMLP